MINREERDKYAQLLRDFISGKITNFEYEDKFDEQILISDTAIDQIYCEMWHTYCDIRKHKLTDSQWYQDDREFNKTVIRFVLFLHSDLEYEWPRKSIGKLLLNLLSFGICNKLDTTKEMKEDGDINVWPFFREKDYEHALSNPRLLNAKVI